MVTYFLTRIQTRIENVFSRIREFLMNHFISALGKMSNLYLCSSECSYWSIIRVCSSKTYPDKIEIEIKLTIYVIVSKNIFLCKERGWGLSRLVRFASFLQNYYTAQQILNFFHLRNLQVPLDMTLTFKD